MLLSASKDQQTMLEIQHEVSISGSTLTDHENPTGVDTRDCVNMNPTNFVNEAIELWIQ